MKAVFDMLRRYNKALFFLLLVASFFVSPAIALFMGIALAMVAGEPFPRFAKRSSKYLLQVSVVGLGFGMNLHESLAAGREGMMFTVVSVVGVLTIGFFLGRWLKLTPKSTHLISAGTAICGGSAIAAVAPVIRADDNDTSLALATIFILNAVALFSFPAIGHWLELSQQQFGMWAAIAIHDTSSVVGAGAAYGEEALKVATTVKLTRALWIIPLALVSVVMFKERAGRISIPWFILFFVLAMVANTYLALPAALTKGLVVAAHKGLSAALFLIGAGLSMGVIRRVGARPLVLGVALWALIAGVTLGVILLF